MKALFELEGRGTKGETTLKLVNRQSSVYVCFMSLWLGPDESDTACASARAAQMEPRLRRIHGTEAYSVRWREF